MLATTESLINKTPNVMGGEACIRRTRIAVWGLVNARRLGIADETLLREYPGLTPEDLAAAWDYYSSNRQEIDREIELQEQDD